MRIIRNNARLIIALSVLCILIFDSRAAFAGAQEGVQLCIHTLIPSLLPFFVISGYFCNTFSTTHLSFLKPLLQLCKIPDGSGALFMVGMLGGYPVGAKLIADAYRDKQIDASDAKRMLGFCNNAGPSFVFGIVGTYFSANYIPWIVLVILILSAILTGWLLPRTSGCNHIVHINKQISFNKIFQSSLVSIASVCGWVILFRVIISILKRWLFWMLADVMQVCLSGVLELANGCISLGLINNDGMRFVISTGLLSFGGLCVYLQTVSVVGDLGTGYYFPGKIIQTSIALILSLFMQYFLFSDANRIPLIFMIPPISLLAVTLAAVKAKNCKITVAILKKVVYNKVN